MNKELWDFCIKYKDRIPVRAQKDGKWGSYYLSEISFKDAVEIILRWDRERIRPVIMPSEKCGS